MSATRLPLLAVLSLAANLVRATVSIEELPEPGLQPQVVTAPDGTVHLAYLVGDPGSADIHYRRRRAGETNWSAPLRVNSQPGSAIAVGTIRGPQLALGREGRAHVCWNGSSVALPKGPQDSAPLLYSCLNNAGDAFEAQRNLMTTSHQLDGGGSLAADANGRVFVFWHGAPAAAKGDETKRAVFLARSEDDGKTFAVEKAVSPPGTGACGCCGLKAFTNPAGDLSVLYRTARSMTERGMLLIASRDHGATFSPVVEDPWQINQCPMSSAALAWDGKTTFAAWETAGRIRATRVGPDATTNVFEISPTKGSKHPFAVTNQRGETLLVWTEGTGWQRGGLVAWQVLDANGKPAKEAGRRDGVPVWSYAAAFARPDGSFVIVR